MIPRRIIHFWHDKQTLPAITRGAIEATKNLHPDYSYLLADDDYMAAHIKNYYGENALCLYNKMEIPQSRSDLARLMLLYHFGGVYLDCSFNLHRSLGTILKDEDEVVLVRRNDTHAAKRLPEQAHVVNSIMAASPKSDFFKWCVEKAINNLIDGDFNTRLVQCIGSGVINGGVYRLQGNQRFTFLNYSELNNDFFSNTRAPGVNNSWLEIQGNGIIDNNFMEKNSKRLERTISFKNRYFHMSLSFLSLKDTE